MEAVLTGRDTRLSGREGRKTMAMVEAAVESAETNSMVRLG